MAAQKISKTMKMKMEMKMKIMTMKIN